MSLKTHSYTNGEITVIWKPEQCIHSTLCWKNLGDVFNPRVRPWIKMEGGSTEAIREQIGKCPSGALSIEEVVNTEEVKTEKTEVVVNANGPIMLQSSCVIKHADGREEIREGKTFLCRCGASKNKPYCDGSHRQINFEG